MTHRAYLDHNATSPLRPEAVEAMTAALILEGNPSSVHAEGRQARATVEAAREKLAALVGVGAGRVVFTSGGTEANVMALSAGWMGGAARARLFVSAIEHASVLRGGRFTASDVELLPVGPDGVIDLNAARERFAAAGAPFMASVMLANNETGAVQPVAALATLAHEFGGLMHTDAVQAAGKLPIDASTLGVDLMSISAHKFGGPKGAGALIVVRDGLPVVSLFNGGGQERGYRAGTENVAAIAGLGAAAETAERDLPLMARIAALRDALEAAVARMAPQAVIFAQGAARLPNTCCMAIPGTQAETLMIALDLDGVAVSAGSACSSGKVARSHVLAAMGVSDALNASAIRVSLGWNSSEAHVERFVAALKKFIERRQAA